MNKHPAISATYDAWLAAKSSQSASTSAATLDESKNGTKRKTLPSSPHVGGESGESAMGPPPTTPSKKKKTMSQHDLFRTPTKAKETALSPSGSIHDSGGSIIDVPLTPKHILASPSTTRKRHQSVTFVASPHRTYEDGNSPSKLRALLSSFSSIQRTPTKGRREEAEKDEDAILMEKLTRGAKATAYTPRTKARKRLRGEVVITPEKEGSGKGKGQAARENQRRSSSDHGPLSKKRRGMAMSTLKDFGIVPIPAPKNRAAGSDNGMAEEKRKVELSRLHSSHSQVQEYDDDDEDEDDEILGPSPSANRKVNRPIKSFKPLFGVEADGSLSGEEGEGGDQHDEPVGAKAVSTTAPLTSLKSLNQVEVDDDDEDRDVIVRPYQRYGNSSFTQRFHALGGALSDDDEDMEFYGLLAAPQATTSAEREILVSSEEEDDDPSILETLSLNSPQCKQVRNRQRVKAQREVRQLLGAEEEIQPLEWEDGTGQTEGVPPKTNKVGPPVKAGKLRKGFKDVKSAVSTTKLRQKQEKASTSLVFQNTREQMGSDQDSDLGGGLDSDDDDEWASDVGSAEYGLGDGYMSDGVDCI